MIPILLSTVLSHPINLDVIEQIESNCDSTKIGSKGERGSFQFMEKTWNWLVKRMKKKWTFKEDAHDRVKAREVADYYFNYLTKYVDHKLKRKIIKGNRIGLIIACYNAGQGNVLKHKGVPPFKVTREYIKKYRKLIHARSLKAKR